MTIIVADTTCGLPYEILEQRGIPVIPQIVMFGEESYHDDKNFDTAVFLQKLKASAALPKTAAPEPSLYFPVYEQARRNGESVVVVAPTGRASGTVRSAQTAAQDFTDVDIRIVDTQTISCNLASLVLLSDNVAKTGKCADEIVAKLNELIPCGRLYFVVDTLEYLAKGGRIGGAKKLLAELLEIKPILQVKDGQVEPFEQHRTKKRALARLVDVATESCQRGDNAHLCVLQVAAEREAVSLVEELKTKTGASQIPIYQLPPAIIVHAGPKAMGLGFFL